VTERLIPPELIEIWSKTKAELPSLLRKEGAGLYTADERKQNVKDTEALFKRFDQNLKGAMQKANQAKDKPSAKTALLEVKRVLDDYAEKAEKWGAGGDGRRKRIARRSGKAGQSRMR
jgi:hypothetical protein